MNKWSIKIKLSVLSGFLLALLLAVGIFGHVGATNSYEKLVQIDKIEIPALRSMTLADMMHDGLRAVVFRSLYVAKNGSAKEKKEVSDELEEMAKDLIAHISKINSLDLPKETKDSIAEAMPTINEYVASANEVVGLALAGSTQSAEEKLPSFQQSFKKLEAKMEVLGEKIGTDANQVAQNAEKFGERQQALSIWLISIGSLLGIFFSFFIIKYLDKTLSAVIEQLTQSSKEVAIASQKSAESASSLSSASSDQASSLQETMASAEEISATVSQNSESALKAQEAVEKNKSVSERGERSVQEVLLAIDDIKTTNNEILGQMKSSNDEFGNIVRIISEIGEKTKVINDIVFQTKLLSFNASVEAARAGEHGKGFSVVAEEVGNLAQMSGNAAKEITGMLSSSIEQVNDIVKRTSQRVEELIEVGKDKITMGQSTAEKCRVALTEISENAFLVANMVGQIAVASKEQAQGVQEINKAIGLLDLVTQNNSQVAQQSSDQATELNNESSNLNQIVDNLVSIVRGGNKTSTSENFTPDASHEHTSEHVVSLQGHRNKNAKVTLSAQEQELRAKAKIAAG